MLESIEKLRKMDAGNLVAMGDGEYVRDTRHDRIADEIEREITELQESWAQEAREHADDACRIADLAAENERLKREIAERYMLLSVDRKNEPWHIGDKFAFGDGSGSKRICTVSGVSENEVFFYYDNHSDATKHRHFAAQALLRYKPRTIEDVLESFIEDYDRWDEFAHFGRGESRNALFARYADEIRKAVGE